MTTSTAESTPTNEEAKPDLYETAIAAVIHERKSTAAFIQKRFSIGFNKAAAIIERMEEDGVVSAMNRAGTRKILIADPSPSKQTSIDTTVTEMKTADAALKPDPYKSDPDFDAQKDKAYRVTASELRSFVERYEQLQAEKEDIGSQQKEVMGEAKSRGYDTKTIRKIIALRKKDPSQVSEEEAILELYKEALGM